MQVAFANNVVDVLKEDDSIIGLAAAGSWIVNELDEFSDLDLIIVTKEKIANDRNKMLGYAERFGNLLNGFTGEHVDEPRLLICLYDNPLLHVDLKFVTLEEFKVRVETPIILLDNHNQLKMAIAESEAKFPYPDYQWIEDRFWIWVHYAFLKIGRGEYFEAIDFFGFVRMLVLGPLLHIKNKNLPRGVRKVETQLAKKDFEDLKLTLADHSRKGLIIAIENIIALYLSLRKELFANVIVQQEKTEKAVMGYLEKIKSLAD